MRERLRLLVRGAVQGVGFRPFIYRLAVDLQLDGWVLNTAEGVIVEAEGGRDQLERFRTRLVDDRPARAVIQSLEASWLDPVPHAGFSIRESLLDGETTTLVMPDIALCDDCRRELFDPQDRRYRYPFINCTNCGPRFSLIDGLPYDRPQTSMRAFTMCPACQHEYDDPLDRRFHAQPNACPVCGPSLALWDESGQPIAARENALAGAVAALRAGRIVAVKGIGGFHLVVDAGRDDAVCRLRERKHREEKPFALMYPSLEMVEHHCAVSPQEARLLRSPEAPIVLLDKQDAARQTIAVSVAPRNRQLGVMLPYSPLHALILADFRKPVIATSGNRADEPMCIDERDAVTRLAGIADAFLVHDRPILRHVDDSIVRVMLGREMVVRRARGYAPLPVPIRVPAPPIVAVGGHLKNSVAVTAGSNVFLSQHIGDLETSESTQAFLDVLGSLERLYQIQPAAVAADSHPDYLSTRYARSLGLPIAYVQHHYAHVASCMAENDLEGPLLGVSWDGTGYGADGTVWGGEFLSVDSRSFTRAACLRPFRLPGGDRAVREPRRAALGVLHALAGVSTNTLRVPSVHAFSAVERGILLQALERGVNSPVTTSAGRLFDAIASLTDLHHRSSFEGQAAMELESCIAPHVDDAYPFTVEDRRDRFAVGTWVAPPFTMDWGPMVRAVLDDVRNAVPVGAIAARVHNTLAEMIVAAARRIGHTRVVLTGGCFQNRYLTERTVGALRAVGFRPYWHQRVPPNDGGLALGQIAAVLRAGRVVEQPPARVPVGV